MTRIREGRSRVDEARAEEVNLRVRERSRWFEPRQTRWGVEPHHVAEARGETPVAGQLEDACMYRLTAAVAARQMRGSHGSHTQAHLKLKRMDFKSSRARSFWCPARPLAPGTRGIGSICPCRHAASCYLWEIQLTSDSLNACQHFYERSCSAGTASLR